MAYNKRMPTSFADIISFCNDTQSERGHSPITNHNDVGLETMSLQSKSPPRFMLEKRFASPLDKEAHELSARKRRDVMSASEKNWKTNLRTKIESDLTDQVQQALAPILQPKHKTSERKKNEHQRQLQNMKLNSLYQHKFAPRFSFESGQSESKSSGFKYIDVNYLPQNRMISGGDTYAPRDFKDLVPRSLANLRLPRRNGLHSHAIYGLEELARAQKHAANIRGGLDVTLLDASRSNFNFLNLPKQDGVNGLRPLLPNAINYNGLNLPNYGLNRRCFQMYTKEGMNSLLNSRSRRCKLTHLGHGKYMDKRGVVLSRLGPFWPQGYGPVCQCPELKTDCPKQENLGPQFVPQSNAKASDSRSLTNLNASSHSNNNRMSSEANAWVSKLQQHTRPNFRTDNPNHSNSNNNNTTTTRNNNYNNTNNSTRAPVHQPHPASLGNSPRDPPNPKGDASGANGGNYKGTWRGKPVIYDCERSSRAPMPHSVPDGMDESLVFESRFESGNLRQVRRISEFEYELVLRTDMYTNRHTQWYYFRVQKAKRGRTYKFNIINLLKKDSLYNYGMKPLVYSEHLANEQGLGWHRTGENIKYMSWNNATRNAILSLDLQYYCLEFEVTFDWEGVEEDTVYLAHCYPYTYSDLRRHLDQIMEDPEAAQHVKKEVLCETTAGNACFLLTITEFPDREKDKYKDFHQEKQGVVLTARVHPGETQASWMMKGVLDFLTSNQPNAKKLRQKYVFKIVPMLNPDGVIVGNYRTSLAARDLNRNYRHPRQTTFPTVWHTKQMVDQFNKDHPIILYCDLHGHSRKHMVFMYGCERKALYNKPQNVRKTRADSGEAKPETQPEAPEKTRNSLDEAKDFVEERLFPWLMYRLAPTRFSFHSTKFAVRRSKESTGRVVMFRQMGIFNSFTMEASFSGTKFNKDKGRHFNIDDFQLIGRKLCECVLEYSRVCADPVAKSRAILEMTREVAQKLLLNQKPTAATSLTLPTSKTSKMTEKPQPTAVSTQEGKPSLSPRNGLTSTEQNLQSSADVVKSINDECRKKRNRDNHHLPQTTEHRENAEDGDSAVCRKEEADEEASFVEKETPRQDETEESGLDVNCFRFLQQLNLQQLEMESESSSESNSDSEPELPPDAPSSSSGGKTRSSQAGSGGRKRKKKKRQQKFGKSVSAPSNVQSCIQQRKASEDALVKEAVIKPKQQVNYPGFVNKYANRSNGGIPIFAQERIKERAARRLAELKLAEEDRKHQENQLRQQLLMAGIQDGPSVQYEIHTSNQEAHDGYSETCGVRYKVHNQPRKVQYMLYNPYRSSSPTSSSDQRPMVTMRFSPPNQLRRREADELPFSEQRKKSADIYTPYRVQAPAGRLSNQRVNAMNSLTELSDSSESRTEPSSSQSSNNGAMPADGSKETESQQFEPDHQVAAGADERFEPRSVVVPVQKYNMSLKSLKKPWHQKAFAPLPNKTDGEGDHHISGSPGGDSLSSRDHLHANVSELVLPPNMDISDVMTAHMRYPVQVHRVEAMKPLPRGRTISRGPPMVFGEPVVMAQKSQDGAVPPQPPARATDAPPGGQGRRVEPRSFVRSATFAHFHGGHQDLFIGGRRERTLDPEQMRERTTDKEDTYERQLLAEQDKAEADSRLATVELTPSGNPTEQDPEPHENRPLFVPRFVAVAPTRKSTFGDEQFMDTGSFSARSRPQGLNGVGGEPSDNDSGRQPFTVR